MPGPQPPNVSSPHSGEVASERSDEVGGGAPNSSRPPGTTHPVRSPYCSGGSDLRKSRTWRQSLSLLDRTTTVYPDSG